MEGEGPLASLGQSRREQLEGSHLQVGLHQLPGGPGQPVAGRPGHQGGFHGGFGPEPELYFGHHAERPEPADLQLGEVVARDILHHQPAAVHHLPVSQNHGAA